MRIGFVVDQFPALSQTFVLRQITGLLDRGHEVDIFAYSSGNEPVTHPDVGKYGLLGRTYYLTACACSDPAPLRLIKRIGLIFTNFHKNPTVVLKTLNITKFGKGALLLQVLCQITPFLGKGPYDIIHCQFGNLGELGLLLKDTGLFRGKLVTSFRGYDISSWVRSNGHDIYWDLFQRGDLFLCVSEHIKEKLIKLGCDEKKIIVHRSGVETKKHRVRPPIATRNGNVTVSTVARLNEKKGIEYGIRAVAKVLEKHQQVEYNIAGDGPIRGQLQHLITELKVGDHVRLLGWKPQDEIAELLQKSDILLAPSVTAENGDEEGIPGVIMEAFAQKLPVVSTLHAGIPEMVHDGESGFVVPERDIDALAERIEELIKRPELRVAMGQSGRDLVEQHYDIRKLNDRLVEIYQQLLSEDSGCLTSRLQTYSDPSTANSRSFANR